MMTGGSVNTMAHEDSSPPTTSSWTSDWLRGFIFIYRERAARGISIHRLETTCILDLSGLESKAS